MPRDITVTLANGQTHIYRNAPDDLTPGQVTERAQRQFGQQVTSLDGGRRGVRPAAPAPSPAPLRQGRGTVDSNLERFRHTSGQDARQAYETSRRSIERRFTNDPATRADALRRFDADPRMQALRGVAGLAPVTTRRTELQDVARRARITRSALITETARNEVERQRQARPVTNRARERNILSNLPSDSVRAGGTLALRGVGALISRIPGAQDFVTAGRAGIRRGALGIPERIAARAIYSSGNAGNLTPEETLQFTRATTDAELEQSLGGNILGQIIGGGGVGAAAANLGRRAIALGAQGGTISRAGARALSGVTRLRRGQRVRNVARISGAGAAFGGAQSLGDGSDVTTGATVGAVAAPILVGALRGVRNLAGREPVQNILQRYVRRDDGTVAARIAERQQQNLPTSVYENLPLRDRQAIDDAIARMPAESRERLASTVREGARNTVQATSNRLQRITQGATQRIRTTMVDDLARSRNDPWTRADENLAASGRADQVLPPAEAAAFNSRLALRRADERLVEQAARSPRQAEILRNREAQNYMEPFDNLPAAQSVNALIPQYPQRLPNGDITMAESSPEISALIRNYARSLNRQTEELTVRDVMALRSDLATRVFNNNNLADEGALRAAVQHIDDYLEEAVPQAVPAIRAMRRQWHVRGQQQVGRNEGNRQRVEEDTGSMNSRDRQAAYGTQAGADGRAMGQAGALEREVLTDPDASLRALSQIADNPQRQQALGQNLGARPASDVVRVAELQTESARRLGRLGQEQGGDPQLSPVRVMQSLLQLSPGTLPQTKIAGLSRLIQGTMRIPRQQSDELVDMLFSQNPTRIAQAMRVLAQSGPDGQNVIRSVMREAQAGTVLGGTDVAGAPTIEGDPEAEFDPNMEIPTTDAVAEDMPADEDMADQEDMPEINSAADAIRYVWPDAVITQGTRDPNSDLGRANPDSWHNRSVRAADVRPVPGMTFDEFIAGLEDQGFSIHPDSRDETGSNRSPHATGDHWHIVLE